MSIDKDLQREKVSKLKANVVTREVQWNDGSVSLQQVQTVTAFNDINESGEQLFVEIVSPTPAYSESTCINPWIESIKQEGRSHQENRFSIEQKEMFLFGMNVLKLPGLVVIHEVMNNGISKEEMETKYGRPLEGTERPAIISLGKTSYEGKSILTTVMKQNGITVVDLDGFSGEHETLGGYSSVSGESQDPKVITRKVQESFNQSNLEIKQGTTSWTGRDVLDKLCESFTMGQNGEVLRPEMVICDLSGYKIWNVSEEGRMINVIDFIRDYSMTCVQLARFEFDKDGNKKSRSGTEVDPREMEDYWKIFTSDKIREKLTALHRIKDDALIEMIAGNQDNWLQKYRYWANQAIPGMQMSLADIDEQIEVEARKEGRPFGQLQVWLETFLER